MSVTLSYEIFGAGDPLVILHGLFGSKRNWFSVARELAGFSRVIALDLRNHGDSGRAPTMSLAEMADDVLQLLDMLRIRKANMLGHSLGGKVAMLYALRHPERTNHLVVLDVAPARYDTVFNNYIEAMRALPLSELTGRRDAEQRLADAVPDFRVRQFLLHNLARSGEGFQWRINLAAIHENLAALSDFPAVDPGIRFAGPARFIAGANSDYLQASHLPLIRRLFPAAVLEIIPDAGHWIHADQPQAVIAQVRAALLGPEDD